MAPGGCGSGSFAFNGEFRMDKAATTPDNTIRVGGYISAQSAARDYGVSKLRTIPPPFMTKGIPVGPRDMTPISRKG